MRSSLRTTIGQFSSAGGRAQSRAANVRAVEPAADLSGAQRGNLYILVEVTGGGHAALYRQMLNAAQTAFYEAEGTLASALVRAVRSAHAALRRANEGLPDASWRAGITCVALHDRELAIAQAGPALILVAHPKTVDMFPDNPADFGAPLGGEERPDVQLISTPIEPNSTVLIAQSGWLDRVPPEKLASAATLDNATQVAEYLAQLAGDAELSALIVEIDGVAPGAEAETPAQAASALPAAGVAAAPVPPRVEVGPAPTATPATPRTGRDGQGTPPPSSAAPAPGSASEWVSARAWTPPAPVDESVEAAPAEPEAGGGVIPEEEQPRRSLWPLLLAIIVIPLIIAALVIAMFWWRGQANEKQFVELLNGATTAVNEAQTLPDEAAARQRLADGRDYLDRAAAIKPGDSRLTDVENRYDENMARVNHLTPLYGVVPLWEFKGDGHKLDRVVASSNSLFVLDRGEQVVDRFTLSDLGDSVTPADPPAVISKTQRLKDQVVGDLVDIGWAEAVNNQHSRLLALDASGSLIGYDATWGATAVPVTGRDKWGYAELVATYSGNLYVVDTKANQIWRYRPGETGYENDPEPYFASGQQVDLAGVRSISIDGNIWLLYADGRLIKFLRGDHQPFELSGLPDKLTAPAAVVASQGGDQIYIGDGGTGTIVEFDKSGKFLRQFRPAQGNLFKDMRSMYLDEGTRLFYVLAGNTLYKADLPRAAQ